MSLMTRVFAAVLAAVALLAGCSTAPDTPTDETAEPVPGESTAAPDDATTETATETTSEPAQGTSDLPDTCALLTQQEVAGATGLPFGPGEHNEQFSSADADVCDWISDDPFATAQVLVTAGGDSFEDQRTSVEEAFGEETVDVDLADAAYRMADGSLVAMRVGDLFVQVSYLTGEAGDVSDATLELARAVLDRL